MISEESAKEAAKAVQEAAKTTGTIAELAGKAGAFVGRIIGGPMEQVGEIFTDRVRLFKYKNLCAVADKVEAAHRRRKIQGKAIEIPPRLAIPILESAALEDDETLREVWAKLLANATDPNFTKALHPGFMEVVKQLSPDEAIMISEGPRFDEDDLISYEHQANSRTVFLHSQSKLNAIGIFPASEPKTFDLSLKNGDALPVYLDNLQRLRILQTVESKAPGAFLGAKGQLFLFTDFGRNFVRYCIADNV